jgi:tetratricopeptide (TPR) repeat protein
MFLHALHGSERSFTAQEKAWARDRILTAMAADLAESASGADITDKAPGRAASAAVPLVSSPRLARSHARSSQTLGDLARGVLRIALLPLEAFSIRSLRLAAIPLVAVLAVVTVWGGLTFDFAPQRHAENTAPDLSGNVAPPTAAQRTTRGLGPVAPESANDARSARSEEDLKARIAEAEARLGPNHPEVAERAMALANIYQSQRRYGEAEALYNRALMIRERAFGSTDPEVAGTLDQLAALYRAQGRTRDAEELSARAAAIFERSQGSRH